MGNAILDALSTVAQSHEPLRMTLLPARPLDSEELLRLASEFSNLRLEQTAEGELIVMPPASTETGGRNFELSTQLGIWARQDGTGKGFDSSTGFKLPDGAILSPDSAWVSYERLKAVPAKQKRGYLPLCPDFVIELRSRTDRLSHLRAKMAEYRENGARLGWLIDPDARRIEIYRPGRDAEILENPERLSAAPELPGFVLELADIWDPGF